MTELNTIFKAKSEIKEFYQNTQYNKHIVIVAGGMSAEREVSVNSAEQVIPALIELGHKVTFIDMGADIAVHLHQLKPDLVFNCLHGTYGEDGCLAGLLNIMNIPYTHSGLETSAIAFDKTRTKEILLNHNIKFADGVLIRKNDNLKQDPLPRPYIIKPAKQGSSVGVIAIFEEDEFNFADYDFAYGDEILVEQFIKGQEINVAVLNGKAIGAIEIKPKNRFYDYEAKYTEGLAEHIYPPNLSQGAYNKALEIAEKIYKILDCRSIARVELIYYKGEFYTLEINTHPGITSLSLCPEIAKYNNIDFKQLINDIVEHAIIEL